MAKKKFQGVYTDSKGQVYYEVELGTDRVTGKRIRKKGRKDKNGKKFTNVTEAYKEVTRLKREYHKASSYGNYRLGYEAYMDDMYIPFYRSDVEESTFGARKPILKTIKERFAEKTLRQITIEDVQRFRTWLLTKIEDGGSGYSQSYASLVFGLFQQSLDKAVELNYLEYNVSRKGKSISKGKTDVIYWTKGEFEEVIKQIYIDDFYEHLNFAILWTYYMTGVRVNEGTALWWNDIDFEKQHMRVHRNLVVKTKTDWVRNEWTKTTDGRRTLPLDDDTISILKEWREHQKTVGLGKENDFIFSFDGTPMLKKTISNFITRYSELANVERITTKGLRHSHASYLINEFNASVLIVSKRLGHSSPTITLKYYAHLWTGIDEMIVQKMAGNIKVKTADATKVKLASNQVVAKAIKAVTPPNKVKSSKSIGA